jgi:hypothetical protein
MSRVSKDGWSIQHYKSNRKVYFEQTQKVNQPASTKDKSLNIRNNILVRDIGPKS